MPSRGLRCSSYGASSAMQRFVADTNARLFLMQRRASAFKRSCCPAPRCICRSVRTNVYCSSPVTRRIPACRSLPYPPSSRVHAFEHPGPLVLWVCSSLTALPYLASPGRVRRRPVCGPVTRQRAPFLGGLHPSRALPSSTTIVVTDCSTHITDGAFFAASVLTNGSGTRLPQRHHRLRRDLVTATMPSTKPSTAHRPHYHSSTGAPLISKPAAY